MSLYVNQNLVKNYVRLELDPDHIKIAWESLSSLMGVEAKVTKKSGENIAIRGIFRDESSFVSPHFSDVSISSSNPQFKYHSESGEKEIEEGDFIVIQKAEYRVIDSHKDGFGGFLLDLQRLKDGSN